jgi:FkbM family methyltransferase
MDGVLCVLAAREAFTVVQVGAFVGDTPNDPLFAFLRATLPDHPSRVAVLVEPVREYFEALEEAYRDMPTVRLENVAIAEEEGERDFYTVPSHAEPSKHGYIGSLTQVSSLRPDRYERYDQDSARRAFLREFRTVQRVHCWTLPQLFARHGLDHVDLLQIDAEGYDYEILRTVDFSKFRPEFINYERILLYEDEPACRAMLIDAGYVLFDWSVDTLAVALPT